MNDADPQPAIEDREDRDIVELFLASDPAAVALVSRWVGRTILRLLGSDLRLHHEDVTQEALIRVYRGLNGGSFAGRSRLRTWVIGVARFTCLELAPRLRRDCSAELQAAAHGPVAGPPSPEQSLLDSGRLRWILAGLPEICRRLFRLVFIDGAPYRVVSMELDLPVGTVKSRMSRCVKVAVSLEKKYSES